MNFVSRHEQGTDFQSPGPSAVYRKRQACPYDGQARAVLRATREGLRVPRR